ncbi:MAG: winged helix-turn-helix domain-containing protein [Aquabacterium sp.]
MTLPPSPHSDPDPWLAGFELGEWRVDVSGNRLHRGAEVRPLRHKAMELLLLLARHAGRTVTRDEIVDAVWDGNRFVAPKAINTAIWTIRQTLGDDPDAPRYLETIAKKGYRLIAPVRLLSQPADPAGQPGAAPMSPMPEMPPAPPSLPPPPVAHRLSMGRWLAVGAVASAAVLGLGWLLRPVAGSDGADAGRAPAQAVVPTRPAAPTPLTQEPGVEYLGALSPDGGWLAFAWWRGRGAGGLYLRRLDRPEQAPALLAGGLGDVSSIAWAPDGQALAFSALDGGGRCRVWLQPLPPADGPARPPTPLAACAELATPLLAWSPDGRHIVFGAEREGVGGLFAIGPDGTGMKRLTTAPAAAMADHQPSWAPDGSHLAFVRHDPSDGTRDLYEWRPDGQVRRLTSLKLHFVHGLAHAADGQDLVFSTTHQDTRVLQRWQRHDGRVQPLGLEGSAPTRAFDGSLVYSLMRTHVSIARMTPPGAPQRILQGVASDRVPRPDPTGNRLAFVSRRSGTPQLWLAAHDGSSARALTTLAGGVAVPAWSPRGDRLAFIGGCGPQGRVGLCIVPAEGGAPLPLVADAANYGEPAWHPQRDEVWVASDRGGQWQLWRFAASGGPGRVEPTDRPPIRAVAWQADGSGFVYQALGESPLRWRASSGTAPLPERRIEVLDAGEELLDWQLRDGAITVLARSDRDRWRRVGLASGRRQALGELAIGTLPERARFALGEADSIWLEVANTQVADLMRLR